MNDLMDRIADLLVSHGFKGVSLKRLDNLTDKEWLVLKQLPHVLIESYYGGENEYQYPFLIIARNRSAMGAEAICSDAVALLQGCNVKSANGSFYPDENGHEVLEYPKELGIDKQGFYVWQAKMACTITTKGRF